ncbi:phospholipase C, phosphocholine-specific [Luteolibacter yonseiensis]|uniref:phospholipase C n=1 Tax=Luteolibacter yonseiensis TaxID=1144680 RepID=A0A934V6D9_9BACT|nr:phospholipase C, phosphocholine-specific [Luteolibacter yonseiensis]MBK1814927.1 phospholipase C, phosphocholine-specific [Luteolibacter yonseiensis]
MLSRREFLQKAAMLSGGLGALAATPPSILKALGIEPRKGSTFMDAEHVVILMQENRSFDHAFGTLRGVRGFEDPRAIDQPGGNPVWLQTDGRGDVYAPFNLDIHGSKATWMGDLPHDRDSQVAAGNGGKHDQWLKVKQSGREAYAALPLTLGYYDRSDIPFYHAFADAFTVCDQHFSSVQTCTTPNRLFLWTGTNRDPRNPEAEPCLDNDQADHRTNVDWTTFPERLEDCGVSWKIYQNEIDLPTGLEDDEASWLSNFGDNTMEYFSQYHVRFSPAHVAHVEKQIAALSRQLAGPVDPAVEPGEAEKRREKQLAALARLQEELAACSPEAFRQLPVREQNLHKKAFTTNTGDPLQRKLATLRYREGETEREVHVPAGDVLHQFRKDVDGGRLPTVSWLVAPENFSDHPSAPWYGAWYVSEVLEILTRDPEVWKKTIFILTYDENDGYYDHVPPFIPPHTDHPASGAASKGIDTALEFDGQGHAMGLGYRVPMVIASPWSRGGNVCSEVFDHTSVLRFLEVFLAGKKTSGRVVEPNISNWRRTVCGDLTSAFGPLTDATEGDPEAVARDTFVEGIHRAGFSGSPDSHRSLTAEEISRIRGNARTSPLLPLQEPGTRPSRALPYELHAEGRLDRVAGTFAIALEAAAGTFGRKNAGAPFQVYAPGAYRSDQAIGDSDARGPDEHARRWSYAVATGDRVGYAWPLEAFEGGLYHLRTYGPNGFHREYRGNLADPLLEIGCTYMEASESLLLTFSNQDTAKPLRVTVRDLAYGADEVAITLPAGGSMLVPFDLARSFRWYDLEVGVVGSDLFSRRYAGRVENGRDGPSDPLIGRRTAAIANDTESKPAATGGSI